MIKSKCREGQADRLQGYCGLGAAAGSLTDSATEQHSSFITAFVAAIMPDSLKRFMGASDVVQSVLVRAIRNRDLLTDFSDEQCRAWLTQVARRRILDGLRYFRISLRSNREIQSQSKHPEIVMLGKSEELGPAELLELNEQAALLLSSIEELPEDVQRVIVMRYSQELTFEQISERINLPVTTCRRKWQKGCKLLKGKLQPILGGGPQTRFVKPR